MSARDRLRQYLEQRRDLGEREFVLDGLPLEEAMRLLGMKDEPLQGRSAARVVSEEVSGAPAPDWRTALRSIGAEPAGVHESPGSSDLTALPTPAPVPPGIVIGRTPESAADRDLGALDTIDAVAAAIAACTRCGLHASAKRSVPGEGSPTAGFICVGEAPGEKEDESGRPFVGRAGELLTKILLAVGFARDDVFICNVLKHRPPGNRNPTPDEITACSPFLLRQLALLQPRVILALGTFAAQTLLQTTQPVGKLRGQVHRYHGVPLIVTYHPAALLRNPSWKRPTWEDVQLARRIFDNAATGA